MELHLSVRIARVLVLAKRDPLGYKMWVCPGAWSAGACWTTVELRDTLSGLSQLSELITLPPITTLIDGVWIGGALFLMDYSFLFVFHDSEWVEIIRRVRGMPEAKVKQLLVHEVNPKNAQGTIDLDAIDSVTSSDQEKR